MGARKGMGPAIRAQDRLHSMKLRNEKRLSQRNGKEDASIRDALEVHETPTIPHQGPTAPPQQSQQTSEQLGLERPKQAQNPPCPASESQLLRPCFEQDTPPATPAHESLQSQLCSELQSHVSGAVASCTAQIKATGDEVSELVSVVS